jgi:copper(I)-binding protein
MKQLIQTTLILCAFATSLWGGAAHAHDVVVKVEGAWARASVKGQTATGAFMRLTADGATRLLRAESPAAGITEVHEMKMEGDVMRMRAVPVLDLPAGKTVELKPGGFHLMFMDLKAPLASGTQVPLTLFIQDTHGGEQKLELTLPVATAAPGGSGAAASGHAHGHKH